MSMKPKQVVIDQSEYLEAAEDLLGFCTNCGVFTNDGVEPDARRYRCDVCEEKTVYGAEEALMEGFITF